MKKSVRRLGQSALDAKSISALGAALGVNQAADAEEKPPTHFQGIAAPPRATGRHISREELLASLEQAESEGVVLDLPNASTEVGGDVDFLTGKIPLKLIVPSPYQPRLCFDPLMIAELADSIRVNGQLTPITVRPLANGMFELIAGECRTRALRQVGLDTADAIIKHLSDDEAMVAALVENNLRTALTLYETGKHLKLIQSGPAAGSQTQLAAMTGMSQATVSRALAAANMDERITAVLDVIPDALTSRRIAQVGKLTPIVGIDAVAGVFEGLLRGEFPLEQLDFQLAALAKGSAKPVANPRFEFEKNQYRARSATIKKKTLTIECDSEEDSAALLKAIQGLMSKD